MNHEKKIEQEAINESVEHLKKGDVILFPSDTIWGLSCDATNPEAVDKILKLKGRSEEKSFIVLVNSDRMINQCVKDFPSVVWDMIDLADKPLTLVLDGGQYVAPKVINNDGSLGIRNVTSGPIFDLIQKFNKPIVSTSPNFSGKPTPTTFDAIDEMLKQGVDYIYPNNQKNSSLLAPSKIVRIASNGQVKILRK
ncbi:MAG: L-threonylcarbamoyladenylate synthase [Vicingaceae bacterium]